MIFFFKSSASTLLQPNGCCFSGPHLNWEEPIRGLYLSLSLATSPQERGVGAKEPFIKPAGMLRSGIKIAPASAASINQCCDMHVRKHRSANEPRPRARAHGTTHAVSDGAQFVEGLDVEPGALVSCRVQHHPHGVLLKQSG